MQMAQKSPPIFIIYSDVYWYPYIYVESLNQFQGDFGIVLSFLSVDFKVAKKIGSKGPVLYSTRYFVKSD